jgi:cytochrome c oxidase subunit 2
MRKQELLAVILVVVFSIGTVATIIFYKIATRDPKKIELLARAPEKGNWSPKTITVKSGEEITLVIKNVDTATHGFYLPAYNLVSTDIKAGEIREVTFTPGKKGEFTFLCSVWCSDYHMHMRGELIVE